MSHLSTAIQLKCELTSSLVQKVAWSGEDLLFVLNSMFKNGEKQPLLWFLAHVARACNHYLGRDFNLFPKLVLFSRQTINCKPATLQFVCRSSGLFNQLCLNSCHAILPHKLVRKVHAGIAIFNPNRLYVLLPFESNEIFWWSSYFWLFNDGHPFNSQFISSRSIMHKAFFVLTVYFVEYPGSF